MLINLHFHIPYHRATRYHRSIQVSNTAAGRDWNHPERVKSERQKAKKKTDSTRRGLRLNPRPREQETRKQRQRHWSRDRRRTRKTKRRKRLKGQPGEHGTANRARGLCGRAGGRVGAPGTREPGLRGWRQRRRLEKLILLVIYSPAFGPLRLPLPPARAACSNIRYKQVNCVMDHIKQALRLEAGFNLHGRLACLPSKAPRGTPSCNRIPPLRAH